MDNKSLAKHLRSLVPAGSDSAGIHIHIHMDGQSEPKEEKRPDWVDETGHVKVSGATPSVS